MQLPGVFQMVTEKPDRLRKILRSSYKLLMLAVQKTGVAEDVSSHVTAQ